MPKLALSIPDDQPETASDLAGPIPGACTPAEWLEMQASYFRSLGSPWSEWLAMNISMMAADARFTGAMQPADVDIRVNIMARVEVALEDMALMIRRAK